MANVAASSYQVPMQGVRRRKAYFMASWSLAATTGVATLIDTDDPQITLTRTAAGTYALTYPAGSGANSRAQIDPTVLNSGTSAAGMATSARLSAIAPSSGTATVQVVGGNSGVAIDPLAADVVTLFLGITVDCNS